jgi:purine-binding chemotaxis protein CheW
VRLQPITRVPHTQPYFLGVINLRGEIIPVMSFRRKFELPDKANTNATRILIVKVDGNKIGILVDEIREVVTLTEDDTEKLGSETNDVKAYITAVGKYNGSLISILNIAGLIGDIDNEW